MTAKNVKSNQMRNHRREQINGILLVSPTVVLMVLLIILPVIAVIGISLTNWQLGSRSVSFVGLRNFQAMLSDQAFRAALINTGLYVIIVAPGTITLGLLVALAINSGGALRNIYRAIHFLPVMATLAAMSIAWEALLHPTIGLFNSILVNMGFGRPNWLADSRLVIPTLCAIGIWQNLGYAMVLFLAGLKSIPSDLYDAADIDGISHPIERTFRITLPMLGPVMMFVTIIIMLKAFEVFDTVRVLTHGGPGHSSEMILHTLYVESFEYFRTGYGSALTVVFLIIVVGFTLTQVRFFDRKVHYS